MLYYYYYVEVAAAAAAAAGWYLMQEAVGGNGLSWGCASSKVQGQVQSSSRGVTQLPLQISP